MTKMFSFIKREPVLVISCVLAVVSTFFVTPDAEYIGYIDFRTLSILFCLMTVVAGMRGTGAFDILAQKMLTKVGSVRQLALIPVLMCFFFSMVITNDVALITLVPFTFTVLDMAGGEYEKRLVIPLTAMETIAANLGSMLTPLGNPQNLYLFGKSDMSIGSFVLLMLPYSLLSLIMLVVWIIVLTLRRNERINIRFESAPVIRSKKLTVVYLILLVVCLLCVMRVLHYLITLVAVLAAVVISDRKNLLRVDYSLLLTFAGFFVFIGNMGRIEWFREFLQSIISDREVVTAVLSSQMISNVPAALLLSGFTENIKSLIIGTNLGGLGTLIASMASLISFKQLSVKCSENKGKYILCFSMSNIIFLIILMGLWLAIG